MIPATVRFRSATPADADALGRSAVAAMAGYRSFAPPGWAPPPLAAETDHTRALLADDQVWCVIAESAGEVVGQISFLPAARSRHAVDDPGLAHLRNLFVREDHWGTGLATELHARAVREARERGFRSMRLFAAADQRRARRFYEREGWAAAGEPHLDPALGLAIVEYRRTLS